MNTICSICLEKIGNTHDDHRAAVTICGHIFCEICLRHALKMKPYSPVRRQYQRGDFCKPRKLNENIPWNPEVVRTYFDQESLDEHGTRYFCLSNGEKTNIFLQANVGIQVDRNVNLVINGQQIEDPTACNQQ